MSKIKLFMGIRRPGRGLVDCIEGEFTAVEHATSIPFEKGRAYAKRKYQDQESLVQVFAEHNSKAEQLLCEFLQVPQTHLIPKVHNPLLSCFSAYKSIQLDGISICYKQVSVGFCYAVVRDEWKVIELCASQVIPQSVKEV
ncbi:MULTISPECIES: hypothetical protein [Pseudoalteromonas]|uniref:hypothetical protein n=1 Tax=Pseudoalteromonas TaxID=53246 RepID=UPI0015815492|nr:MULTISPECIES: hypothetical protein [Pseudoalteromonas]MDI4654237.1 hypothetical protein [Pseudoalteromonas shioyasakiensis]NUJ40191.1 hypothetical protein [Pseudoalteromonas sp. 0303]